MPGGSEGLLPRCGALSIRLAKPDTAARLLGFQPPHCNFLAVQPLSTPLTTLGHSSLFCYGDLFNVFLTLLTWWGCSENPKTA